ncbi:MAG: hypothetical protein KBT01_07440 [Clostridiales bacterium]|nr:hypothetical protein [Candidatus Blautia equi]
MKKITSVIFASVLSAGLLCTGAGAEQVIDSADLGMHKIGVVVYNLNDEQVIAFRDYLENYIELCFPDVDFLYSSSVNNMEQEMQFIQDASDAGVEGILSFNSYDLEAEVKLCEENGIYYMRASSGVSDEDYAKVAENPYFIGAIGPDTEMEYQAGYDMGKYFAENQEKGAYFICSGGAGFGVGSHRERVKGMIDGLQDGYGVTVSDNTAELAAVPVSTTAEADGLKICVTPGFLDSENFLPAVVEAYEQDTYPVVLSAYPLSDFAAAAEKSIVGVIDCYSETNLQLFTSGRLHYVSGKFSSSIGPSFVSMYNAVTGYAEAFREDGRAFRISQDFWTSDSLQDYVDKYTLSSSVVLNAYSAEDLMAACKQITPECGFADLKDLAEASSFEDAFARRFQ